MIREEEWRRCSPAAACSRAATDPPLRRVASRACADPRRARTLRSARAGNSNSCSAPASAAETATGSRASCCSSSERPRCRRADGVGMAAAPQSSFNGAAALSPAACRYDENTNHGAMPSPNGIPNAAAVRRRAGQAAGSCNGDGEHYDAGEHDRLGAPPEAQRKAQTERAEVARRTTPRACSTGLSRAEYSRSAQVSPNT